MKIIYFLFRPFFVINEKLDRIIRLLQTVRRKEDAMDQSLEQKFNEMVAAINEETTVIASNTVLLDTLTKMLEDAIAAGDVEAIKAKIVEITSLVQKNKTDLNDAVVAHTPAAPQE